MTRYLSAKIGPFEAGIGHAKPSESSVRHFVFYDLHAAHFLIERCPCGQPVKKMIDPTSVILHTSGGENHDHSETASAGGRAYRPCGTLGTANKTEQENKCK